LYKNDIGCLAFTSSKNPGGGFLGGSAGQEESIARSSGYYKCLLNDPCLYEFNRKNKTYYHSDHVMVSKNVPVIRDEIEPYALCEPWNLTVISAPAVNAGMIRFKNLGDTAAEEEIHFRMRNRIKRILGAAFENGVKYLVLGQYGCGALENNPCDVSTFNYHHEFLSSFHLISLHSLFIQVARYFSDELVHPDSPFRGAFLHIIFAISDYGVQNNSRQRRPSVAFTAFSNEFSRVGAAG